MTSFIVLSAEDLLAGTDAIHEVTVPEGLLASDGKAASEGGIIHIRALSIGVFQLVMKAAKEDLGLIPLLMIKECLVEPKLDMQQIRRLPVGLVEFLVTQIRIISGLIEKKTF